MDSIFVRKQGREAAYIGGVFDALTSHLTVTSGFDAVWVSSFGVSASHGFPDNGTLGSEDYFERIHEIRRCTRAPIILDAESAFTDVETTIMDSCHAGIDAVAIEDRSHPKMNSFCDFSHCVETIATASQRYERALVARPPGTRLAILARTEAFIAGETVAEVARRCRAYSLLGVDGLIVNSRHPTGRDALELLRVLQPTIPLILIATSYGSVLQDFDDLPVCGFIFANQALRAAWAAFESAVTQISRDRNTARVDATIPKMKQLVHTFDNLRHATDP